MRERMMMLMLLKEVSSDTASSSDDYHFSAQHDMYIKEWTDPNGNSYMESKDGKYSESYNKKTGVLTTLMKMVKYPTTRWVNHPFLFSFFKLCSI